MNTALLTPSRAMFCLLAAIGVGIPAQTVHLVAPGSALPEIGSALAIAAPGDVIHVMPGTYAPFAVGIGCTIRALAPGVQVLVNAGPNPVTINAPAGQVVHIVGVSFAFNSSLPGDRVDVTGGRVTFDSCVFGSSYDAPLVIVNADVHLQSCSAGCSFAFGFYPAMRGTNARITAIDSTFLGSPTFQILQYFAAPGVDLTGTTLHASGCTMVAGISQSFAVPALRAFGGSVWLSDSSLTGRVQCPVQANALAIDRCVLQPTQPACTNLPSGGLLGVTRPQPLQNGAPFSLTYQTIPNSYAAVFASQELATLTIPGLHAQTQWLGGGIFNLGVVLADASGQATGTWSIPAGAWLVDQPLWFQGLTGFALPLQLSPVAGGVIR